MKAEAVRLELTSEMCSPPVFKLCSSTAARAFVLTVGRRPELASGRTTSKNCGGRNRTHVTTVQSRLSVPAQTPPHHLISQVVGSGIEPADPSFKATHFYQQKPPCILKSDLRESNPPVQLGRLAPLPLGQGHMCLQSSGSRGTRTHKRVSLATCFQDRLLIRPDDFQ